MLPILSHQVEATNAEFELLIHKMKSEGAELRDSLAKMGALNEGLAQDKISLNRIVLQVTRHHDSLL